MPSPHSSSSFIRQFFISFSPWKESNLALIGSNLDHKIKAQSAEEEREWQNLAQEIGLHIWRIEDFKLVPWPKEMHGNFHKGDSYVVLNTYKEETSQALRYDAHIWIGLESSQDEYGTAAYKMVECDEALQGRAVQHREVQGRESVLFLSYFGPEIKYLEGGFASGFLHVEASKDQPHLYRVKKTEKGMALTQFPLKKSSLNTGDSFILFANESSVWVWNGESANPNEKFRAISLAERMCKEGTVTVLDQGDDDGAEFLAFLEDGDIREADDEHVRTEEFAPLLFRLPDPDEDELAEPEQVGKGEVAKKGSQTSTKQLKRSLLDEKDTFVLDTGWEVFLWVGKDASRSEKIAAVCRADSYCQEDPRTVDMPLSIEKSGFESLHFLSYFC
jgi:gelsolin